jgi:hypothetical protein
MDKNCDCGDHVKIGGKIVVDDDRAIRINVENARRLISLHDIIKKLDNILRKGIIVSNL